MCKMEINTCLYLVTGILYNKNETCLKAIYKLSNTIEIHGSIFSKSVLIVKKTIPNHLKI